MSIQTIISRTSYVIVILIAISACKNSDKEPENVLKFSLKEDSTYHYTIQTEMDQEMEGQTSKFSILSDYSITLLNEENAVQQIRTKFDRFLLNVNAGGMNMEIDTDQPLPPTSHGGASSDPAELMTRLFTAIKDREFIMKVDGKGNVQSVSGMEKVVKQMVDSLVLDEDQKMQMKISLNDQFSDMAMKEQLSPVFAVFPNRTMKVGDTWESHYSHTGRLAANYINVFTVKAVNGSMVTLAMDGTIKPPKDEEGLQGTQSGTIVIDASNSLIISGDYTQKMKMIVEGMTINVDGKMTIKGRIDGR